MPVQEITAGAELSAGRRGSCVICIIVDRAAEDLAACIGAVVAHSSADAPILVCDYTPSDSTVLEALHGLGSSRTVFHLSTSRSADAVELVSPADVVLLRAGCTVASGWLEGMRDAAYADSRVATATAIAERQMTELKPAAAAVRAASLRLRPCIAAAGHECVYVRRTAIDLIGVSRPPSLGDLVWDRDFSSRCVQNGLAHVLADDVLVSAPRAGGVARQDRSGPVVRALGRARRARSRLSVIVDAGILSAPITGTQVNVLETIAALARTDAVALRVLVPDGLNADAARRLAAAPEVQLLTHAEAGRLGSDRADLVHRPFQISNPGELPLLSALADRLVITHQDLIGYFNPAYSASHEAWQQYRQLTRGVLAVADRVLFVSGDARDEALAEELVEPGRATVVHLGVDHRDPHGDGRSSPPAGVAQLRDDAPMMLCIGADYHHKNRPFALRVLAQMRSRHNWDGCLVFAGPHVRYGSSAADEAEIARGTPGLAGSVLDCGAVTESEKAWLYQRAGLVMYPTVHEGFGLVPFEAAEHGIPCMWAAGTSLSEVLPEEAASIVAWDAELTAQRAIELLADGEAARRDIDAVAAAGAALTWDATAGLLLEAYGATCDGPAAPAGPSERRHGRISTALSEDSMRLIGPGGALPSDVERPLLALATHPRIAAPLFGALKLGYRTGFRLRRLGNDGADGDDAHRRR